MQSPQWILGLSILLVNTALVVITSVTHFGTSPVAETPQAESGQQPLENAASGGSTGSPVGTGSQTGTGITAGSGHPNQDPPALNHSIEAARAPSEFPVARPDTDLAPSANSPNSQALLNLPIPEELPEAPSISEPQMDQLIEEMRSMFGENSNFTTLGNQAPPLAPVEGRKHVVDRKQIDAPNHHTDAPNHTAENYFDTLEQRMKTVRSLVASAQRLASEAAMRSRNGQSRQAAHLLKLATQLREMAAELLVGEL